MLVDVIDDFICLAECFFSILEMKVATPRKDDVVALMDFKQICVQPVYEILHFLLGVEGAKCGIIIHEIIRRVEIRSKTVSITEDGSQNLLFISEMFLIWSPEEIVRLILLPGSGFALIVSCYKQSFKTQISKESGICARMAI